MSRTGNWRQWFLDECRKAARSAIEIRTQIEPNRVLYLYGRFGSLRVSDDPPPSKSGDLFPYVLVTPEQVPMSTLEEIEEWVRVQAARFPCLPVNLQ